MKNVCTCISVPYVETCKFDTPGSNEKTANFLNNKRRYSNLRPTSWVCSSEFYQQMLKPGGSCCVSCPLRAGLAVWWMSAVSGLMCWEYIGIAASFVGFMELWLWSADGCTCDTAAVGCNQITPITKPLMSYIGVSSGYYVPVIVTETRRMCCWTGIALFREVCRKWQTRHFVELIHKFLCGRDNCGNFHTNLFTFLTEF